MKMGSLEWAMLITLSVFWGASFLFVGIAVSDVPPLTIVLARVGLSAIILHIILIVLGHKFPVKISILAAFFIMGLLNNAIPFSLITYAQGHITSGLASILNATTPIFTVIVAHFFTIDEKLNGQKIIGALIGFSGVSVMMGLDTLSDISNGDILAQLSVLSAASSYAFAVAFGRKFKDMKLAPLTVATGQVTASSIIIVPIVLLFEQPWQLPVPHINSIIALVFLAILSTVFAYILFFKILERAGATNLALVTFLIPPSAILFGIVLLDEELKLSQVLGMIIIAIGLVIIDGRVLKPLRS